MIHHLELSLVQPCVLMTFMKVKQQLKIFFEFFFPISKVRDALMELAVITQKRNKLLTSGRYTRKGSPILKWKPQPWLLSATRLRSSVL